MVVDSCELGAHLYVEIGQELVDVDHHAVTALRYSVHPKNCNLVRGVSSAESISQIGWESVDGLCIVVDVDLHEPKVVALFVQKRDLVPSKI